MPVRQHSKTHHLPAQPSQIPLTQLCLLAQRPQLCPLGAEPLHHPGPGLGRHRHKGPLIGVLGILQLHKAQLFAVHLTLHMAAGAVFRAAHGAHAPPHAASHADLFLDTTLDLRDQLLILFRPHEVGPALQPTVLIPRRRHGARFPHHLRPVNTGRLALSGPLVIKDSALA